VYGRWILAFARTAYAGLPRRYAPRNDGYIDDKYI
jgi:hypothetical protein